MGDFARSAAETAIEAARQWLASAFPHVAVSIGAAEDGFLPVPSAWDAGKGNIEPYLEYQTVFAEGMDRRTQAAHLIALYSHQFSVVAVFLYMEAGLTLGVNPLSLVIRFEAPEQLHSSLPSDLRRFHFRFSDDFLPTIDGGPGAFHDAFVCHLTPVIAGLGRHTGFSAAAQWRLAADSLAGAFLDVGGALGREGVAMDMALDIVRRKASPLLSPDLRFETIEAIVDGRPVQRTFRLRGGCCLFYRTQEGRFCDSCVLLDADSQRTRLRAFMEDAGSS